MPLECLAAFVAAQARFLTLERSLGQDNSCPAVYISFKSGISPDYEIQEYGIYLALAVKGQACTLKL